MAKPSPHERREERRSSNEEALELVFLAAREGRRLTDAEKQKVHELYTGLGGLVATTFKEYRQGVTRRETMQQYYTPPEVGDFMLGLCQVPANAAIWDGAFGVGRMFWEYAKRVNIRIAGVEYDRNAWAIASALFDDPQRFNIIHDDLVLHNPPENLRNRYDYTFGNPPYSIALADIEEAFERTRHSSRGNINSHFAYMEAAYNQTRENGIIAVIMPTGWLHRGGSSPEFTAWWKKQTILLADIDLGTLFESTSSGASLYIYQRMDSTIRRLWGAAFEVEEGKVVEEEAEDLDEEPGTGKRKTNLRRVLDDNDDLSDYLDTGEKDPEDREKAVADGRTGWWATGARAVPARVGNHDAAAYFGKASPSERPASYRARIEAEFMADPVRSRAVLYAAMQAGKLSDIPKLERKMGKLSAATLAFSTLAGFSEKVDLASNTPPTALLHIGKPSDPQTANRPTLMIPNGVEAQAILDFHALVEAGSDNPMFSRPVYDLYRRFLQTNQETLAFLEEAGIRVQTDQPSARELADYRSWAVRQEAVIPRSAIKRPILGPDGKPQTNPDKSLQFEWVSINDGPNSIKAMMGGAAKGSEWSKIHDKTNILEVFDIVTWEPQKYLAEYFQERIVTEEGDISLSAAKELLAEIGIPRDARVVVVAAGSAAADTLAKTFHAPRIEQHPDAAYAAFVISPMQEVAVQERVAPITTRFLSLYEYQRQDVTNLFFKDRALLAYVMGLGKTRTSIALAVLRHSLGLIKKCAFIVPAGLIDEWQIELQKLGIPSSMINVISGNFRESVRVYLSPNDNYQPRYDWNRLDFSRPFQLISVEALTENAERLYELRPDGSIKVGPDGKPIRALGAQSEATPSAWLSTWLSEKIDMAVVDEAYYFSNPDTNRTAGLYQLRPRYRLALTGTPIKGYPSELHTLLTWLLEDIPGKFLPYADRERGAQRWADTFGCVTAEKTVVTSTDEHGNKTSYVKYEHNKASTPAISNIPYLQEILAMSMLRRLREEDLGDDARRNAPPVPIVKWVGVTADKQLMVDYGYAGLVKKLLEWWKGTAREIAIAQRGGSLPVVTESLSGAEKSYASINSALGEMMGPVANLTRVCSVPQLVVASVAKDVLGKSWFADKAKKLKVEVESETLEVEGEKPSAIISGGLVSPTAYHGVSEDDIEKIAKAIKSGDYPETAMQQHITKRLLQAAKEGRKALFITDNYASIAYRLAWAKAHGVKALTLTGDDNSQIRKTTGISPRRAQLNLFRRSQEYNLLVSTIGTIAEGYNIPEASIAVFDFIAWTPSKMRQAVYRMARPGQKVVPEADIAFVMGSMMSYMKFLNTFKARSIDELLDWDGLAEIQEDEAGQTAESMFAYLYALSDESQEFIVKALKDINDRRRSQGLAPVEVPKGGSVYDIDDEEVLSEMVQQISNRAKFAFMEQLPAGSSQVPRGIRGAKV